MKNVVFLVLRRVAIVKTDVSEERSASIIRVTRIGELGTVLAVTSTSIIYIVLLRSVRRLLVTANADPSSPTLVSLIVKALLSSKRLLSQEPHGVTSQKTFRRNLSLL
jgi:hypothetical protein